MSAFAQLCHRFLARLDPLLPGWAREADAETRGRVRLFLLLAIAAALAGAASSLVALAQGGEAGWAVPLIACSAAALGTLAIPFWSGRLRGATASFCAVLFVALVAVPSLGEGTPRAPIGVVILPFLATALGGLTAGLVWTGLVVIALGLRALSTTGDPAFAGTLWQTAILAAAMGLASALFELVRAQARLESVRAREQTGRDLRERDRAETAEQTIRELFTVVFHQAPAFLVLSDFDTGRIQDVSEGFERMLGWTLEEARGRTLTELHGWSSQDDRDLLSERLLRDGLSKNVEIPLRTRSGDTLWLLLTAGRIELEGRSYLLAQGIDITQRKRSEKALEQTRERLEERVSRRTEQLRESRIELRRQRQITTVGALAGGIAHQINNPIASIKAAAEFALLTGDRPESNLVRIQALRTAIDEAERCGRIVRNVLKFSRREPTAQWVEDLNEIVQRAAALSRSYLDDAGARLRLQIDPAPILACISPIEIEQAVVHLLRNAAEALQGGGDVRLSTRRREGVAEIEIADDGCGIPLEDRERVLEPFYTTRLALGGTGLGLAFVDGVIRGHGGELRIESERGKGTRIQVRLPLI